jgi:LPS export ABC transporter protein LptC
MNIGQIRFVKQVLFLTFLGCGAYVGYHVWDGVRNRGASATEILDEPESATSRLVELEQLDSEGRTAWTLKAAESVGRTDSVQSFRDVEIRFDTGDGETPIVVTAEDCEIGANSTVHLEGNVVVRDETTVRLEANTLEFGRFPDRVWSEEPVRYSKQGLSGTAGSMHYIIKRGELDLDGGVRMTIQEEGDAPVRVESVAARMRRNQHWVDYIDKVRVRQQRRTLEANDLQLYFDEANEELVRVEAYEKVVLQMRVPSAQTAGADEPASDEDGDVSDSRFAPSSEPGVKRLETDRLEMFFRPGGQHLERARARDGGRLVMRVPRDSAGYNKSLAGHVLAFDFDEQGQLTALRGRGGVELVLTPRGGEGGDEKIVRSRELDSDFDPITGELVQARCLRAVEFEQGDVRAAAERGVFRAADSKLILTRSPRLWDTRANLEAEKIEIDIDSGNVEGFVDVRSTSLGDSGGGSLFPAAENEAVHFVADHLVYRRADDVALYSGSARGFQGGNRIEAETIQIHQQNGDLVAGGGVRSVFLQRLVDDSSSEHSSAKPTVTRAKSMHYRAAKDVLEYREDVQMRSEDMVMQGASIDVILAKGGGDVIEVAARGDVTIETTEGKAAGDDARYLPEDESMTVSGEKAWLENDGKLTEGKQLTFFLTDDKILVDGQEQRRTKTTYTSKPRPF